MHVSLSGASACPEHRSTTYAARARRALAVATATVALAAPAAQAEDGFDVDSTSRYVLDAKKEVVRATVTMTVTNERPSYTTGNYIHYFYLPSITIPVPVEAAQVTAVSNGAPLSVTREPTKDPSTEIANIAFPSNLLYGQSRTVTVSFVLEGEEPRSKNQTRVGPGYATFAVYGRGDAGQNTVQVVLPASMTFDATTDDFDDRKDGKTVTYTATTDAGDSGFWAVISARDLDIARTRTVELGDQEVEVQAFSDDKEWLRFVASRMTSGVPLLAELVGTPWPGGLTTVREDLSPNLRGYDGWFDSSEDSITIGEELDQELLYHELLHAWASQTAFEERWLYEGIAEYISARAVATQGDKPTQRKPVSTTSKHALPLNTWGEAAGRSQPTDSYGYPASYRTMKELLGGMDDGIRSIVLAAAIAGKSAYAVPGETRPLASRTGWQRFLDLVQVMGHNDKAPRIFSEWVLTPTERKQLDDRRRALADYQDVDAADGPWVPPLGVRTAMTDWAFEHAQQTLTQVADLGPAVIAVQKAAQRHDMGVPEQVVALYQDAESTVDYDELSDTLPKAATAVDAVGTADAAAVESRNPVTALGAFVLGVDDKAAEADDLLAEGDLEGATTAAREASDAAERSTLLGGGLLAVGLALLAGTALLGRALSRRRARRRQARAYVAPVAPSPVDVPGSSVVVDSD
ncbi:hypothetical protein F0U44_18045 [Nocardioides humilatus]|uniref:Peptidase M1 membrane alanine aminopeptidase domain-containing protein n=1 Tax=Nocardioides humilatus TaxID=2607660 RepID=A0A5B1L9X2_9ACTN|nr:hypothetical protein [Nocardioides humilatus]KAA1417074.1 hypothetical protein F0U44_18045 [Nocardioides humilatus]